MILIICSFYSFIANASIIGPSPYIDLWAEEFGISPAQSSELISYPNLAFGFGKYNDFTRWNSKRTDATKVP